VHGWVVERFCELHSYALRHMQLNSVPEYKNHSGQMLCCVVFSHVWLFFLHVPFRLYLGTYTKCTPAQLCVHSGCKPGAV